MNSKESNWILRRVGKGNKEHLVIHLHTNSELTIGRGLHNNIKLQSTYLSRSHCKLHIERDRVVLTVFNTTNGVLVNKTLYRDEVVQLKDGDRVAIGCVEADSECDRQPNVVVYYLHRLNATNEQFVIEDGVEAMGAAIDLLSDDEDGNVCVKKEIEIKSEAMEYFEDPIVKLEPELIKQEPELIKINMFTADEIMTGMNDGCNIFGNDSQERDNILEELNENADFHGEDSDDDSRFQLSQIVYRQIKDEDWELDDIGVPSIIEISDTDECQDDEDIKPNVDDLNDCLFVDEGTWRHKLLDMNGRVDHAESCTTSTNCDAQNGLPSNYNNNININNNNDLNTKEVSAAKNSNKSPSEGNKKSPELNNANSTELSSSTADKPKNIVPSTSSKQNQHKTSSSERSTENEPRNKETTNKVKTDKKCSKKNDKGSSSGRSSSSSSRSSEKSSSSSTRNDKKHSSRKESSTESKKSSKEENSRRLSHSEESSRNSHKSTGTCKGLSLPELEKTPVEHSRAESSRKRSLFSSDESDAESSSATTNGHHPTERQLPDERTDAIRLAPTADVASGDSFGNVLQHIDDVAKRTNTKSIKVIEPRPMERKRKRLSDADPSTPSKKSVKFGDKSEWTKKKKTNSKRKLDDNLKERLKKLADEEMEKREARIAQQPKPSSSAKMKITKVNRSALILQDMESNAKPKKRSPTAKEPSSYKIPKLSNKTAAADVPKEADNQNEEAEAEEKYTTVSFKKKPIRIARKPASEQNSPNNESCSSPTTNCDVSTEEVPEVTESSARKPIEVPKVINADKPPLYLSESFMKRFSCTDQSTAIVEASTSLNNNFLKGILKKCNTKSSAPQRSVTFNDDIKIEYFDGEANENQPFNINHTPMQDILNTMTKWPPSWLTDKNSPINGNDHQNRPMMNKFASIEEYKNIVMPLMKLELLSSIVEDNVGNMTLQLSAQVSHRRKSDRGSGKRHVLCAEMFKKTRDIARGMLCIVHHGFSYEHSFLAYCDDVRLVGQQQTEMMTFSLETAADLDTDKIIAIKITPVAVVLHELRIFNAIMCLERFPLSQNILDPMLNQKVPFNICEGPYAGVDTLSKEQTDILMSVYSKCVNAESPHISLIEGPPGTGKSLLITNFILQLLFGQEAKPKQMKILLCAQSNLAVDNIVGKLCAIRSRLAEKFSIVRFGVKSRVHPKLYDVTIEHLVELERDKLRNQHASSLRDEKIHLENQVRDISKLVQGNSNSYANDQLADFKKRLAHINNCIDQKVNGDDSLGSSEVHKRILVDCQIVCSTLSSCANLLPYINFFDICIVDEATQCTEPVSLMPLQFHINSLVLVGDTRQLPATVRSRIALQNGFEKSLFLRISESFQPTDNKHASVHHLTTQYRMNPEICKWPNAYFYNHKLISDFSTFARVKFPFKPYYVFSLDSEQKSDTNLENHIEAQFVIELYKKMSAQANPHQFSYGIVTPYVLQRNLLAKEIGTLHPKVTITTIDACQGQEKDIVIISCSRSKGIGFLKNAQRLNVAVTRARLCLIICGNFQDLQDVSVWKSLLNDADDRKVLVKLSDNDLKQFDNTVMNRLKK